MYPEIKKFSLLKDSLAPIATDHVDEGGSEVLLSDSTSPQINYMHVIETWKCLDCKYEGDDGTFITRNKIISDGENACGSWSSSETTTHCPKCDSANIKFPDPPKIVFHNTNPQL